MAGTRQEVRRAERKIARETRAKEQAKTKMRDEIRRLLIDKGNVADPSVNTELMQIHGCYEKTKGYQGAVGGQLQQLYYVVNAILQKYDDKNLVDYYTKLGEDPKNDVLKNPRNPRELLLENFFVPFVATAIKELKCEEMKYLITPQLDALIQPFKLPRNSVDCLDFTKLTPDQYLAFRYAFVEERMFNETFMSNKGSKAMDMILSVICMIVCNRIPKGVVSFRTDSLASKIKLVQPPRGIEVEDRILIEKTPVTADNPQGVKETLIEKNINEKAIVRILVPKRTMTMSEVNAEENKREEE